MDPLDVRRLAWRTEDAEFRAKLERNQFLHEWLSNERANQAEFAAGTKNFSDSERQACAVRNGFRTWASLQACCSHQLRAMELYATHPTFQALWKRLREWEMEQDAPGGQEDYRVRLYGPHRIGMPDSLLGSIRAWHRTPKFTASGLEQHKQKIASKCDELLELLNQVSPSHDDQFGWFHLSGAEVDRLFKVFQLSEERAKKYRAPLSASILLQYAGITPQFALQGIKHSTGRRSRSNLPTKVRTPTALRTYMISEVFDYFRRAFGFGCLDEDTPLPVSSQTIADIVSLLVNMDCTAEDVRKAGTPKPPRKAIAEDSGS